MKINTRLLGLLGLLLLLWQPRLLWSQQEKPACQDVLHIAGGNRLVGQIMDLTPGDTLIFQTWGGTIFHVPRKEVLRIVQHCRKTRGFSRGPKAYNFRERGWYHHTRGSVLLGQAYYGFDNVGVQVQHSSGRMFSRLLGVGLGTGIERFDPDGTDAVIYPIFAEMRGYLHPKRFSVYYNLGAGWGFVGRSEGERWGFTDTWRGGWLTQGEIGYRIGNHFTIHAGLRLQRKYRDWTSNWWGGPDGFHGTDRILHKRFIIGLGLLL